MLALFESLPGLVIAHADYLVMIGMIAFMLAGLAVGHHVGRRWQ